MKDMTDNAGWVYEIRRLYTVPLSNTPYKDSTSPLNVGESSFEYWYQSRPEGLSEKQLARDAYAAGMGDPLVTTVIKSESEKT